MIELIKNKDNNKMINTFLNPFSYIIARSNKDQLSHFNINIDGGLLVILLNLFGFKYKRKSFDMTSLAPVVFNDAIKNNKSIYFIGSKPKVIDFAIKNIQDQFPKLKICGYRDGYIEDNEMLVVFSIINSLKADYVICGMGTPLQEHFLIDLQKSGWNGKGYTCGGFLHQTAAGIKYYPNWVSALGLRAFFRMYDEPKLIRRYFIDYPRAIIIILCDLITDKFR
tara:strand:- start:718 stop:1389 length:672 start_codon:yes stop_codon:yes gene_type:complete